MPAALAVMTDRAESIDPPDALNAECFQAGKLTSLLPKHPHFLQSLLVKHVYQEEHRFYWYHQLCRGSLNDSSVWQGLWHLTTVALPAKVFSVSFGVNLFLKAPSVCSFVKYRIPAVLEINYVCNWDGVTALRITLLSCSFLSFLY